MGYHDPGMEYWESIADGKGEAIAMQTAWKIRFMNQR